MGSKGNSVCNFDNSVCNFLLHNFLFAVVLVASAVRFYLFGLACLPALAVLLPCPPLPLLGFTQIPDDQRNMRKGQLLSFT